MSRLSGAGGLTETCRWCGGSHAIEFCPEVLAAFVPGYTPYTGNAHSSSSDNPRKFRPKALTRRRRKGKA